MLNNNQLYRHNDLENLYKEWKPATLNTILENTQENNMSGLIDIGSDNRNKSNLEADVTPVKIDGHYRSKKHVEQSLDSNVMLIKPHNFAPDGPSDQE